ncbi:MAG: hypothetical protein HKL90_15505 [Elusimicrobia bacterium]|nr:hypothetical protein [Elusimicrobiota bacterium]
MTFFTPLILAALAAVSPARAADSLSLSCYNELGMLCPGRHGAAAVRCLRENADGLMTDCRRALAALSARDAAARAASEARSAALPEPVVKVAPSREARLVGAAGAVFLHLGGRPDDQLVPAASGAPAEEGDSIVVGPGPSSAELSLDGKAFVVLSSGTELALTSLSLARTELGLVAGSLAAKIDKLAADEELRVRAPAAVAAVRGTELLVAQDAAGGRSLVGVVDEGRVEVEAGGKTVTLAPGQETSALPHGVPQAPAPLSALRSRAAAFAVVRAGATAAARAWKPRSAAARQAARERLFRLAPRARAGVVRPGARPAGAGPARKIRPLRRGPAGGRRKDPKPAGSGGR